MPAETGAGVIGDILEVIWVSLVAGVGITAVVLVRGARRRALRGGAARRAQSGAAIGYGALAAFFLLVFLGGFVFAIADHAHEVS